MSFATAIGVFADSEPVTRWRRAAGTPDAAGDQRRGKPEATALTGVSVVPGTATEDSTTGFAQLNDTATLMGPGDLDLLASDEVEWRGRRWTVQGTPTRWPDPLASGVDSLVAELRYREG